MNPTDHPLTEAHAREMWDSTPTIGGEWLWHQMDGTMRRRIRAAMRAAYDAGREHVGTDPHHDPRPWQDCTRKDIRKGDLVEAQEDDILHVGVAHRQDDDGDWWTKDGHLLTYFNNWPLRRIPAPNPPAEEVELPTEHPAHITDVGHVSGGWATYVALDRDGFWTGVDGGGSACAWEGDDLTAFTFPDGTRARRDGEHEDDTPRFVKVQEEEK